MFVFIIAMVNWLKIPLILPVHGWRLNHLRIFFNVFALSSTLGLFCTPMPQRSFLSLHLTLILFSFPLVLASLVVETGDFPVLFSVCLRGSFKKHFCVENMAK